jgi:hypothetical protein
MMEGFLEGYSHSTVLQDFIFGHFESLFYSTLISNFFSNLTRQNVKEEGLPDGKIREIRLQFKRVQNDIESVTNWKIGHKVIDEQYYSNFKSDLKKHFPKFIVILYHVEAIFDLKRGKRYLSAKKKIVRRLGTDDNKLETSLITSALETHIKKGKGPFKLRDLQKLIKNALSREVILKFADSLYHTLKKEAPEMLMEESVIQMSFEARLYSRWKEPLDLLESLIKVSWESGDRKKDALIKIMDKTNQFHYSALIRLHARALLISHEIFALLNKGYPDGAFARWRSLHELSIICVFLNQTNNIVSERYLDHSRFKHYKDALDYQTYAKKLGYTRIPRRDLNYLKRECDKLIQKHGPDFTKADYDWIPKNILADRNFRALEKFVKLDKYRPYYNMSSTSVHGGSRAFHYNLGLMSHKRNEVLLTGPSNYGHADPIQNTAISLMYATMSLLTIKPDLQDSLSLAVLGKYVMEIGPAVVKVQREIEKEEREMRAEKRKLKKRKK